MPDLPRPSKHAPGPYRRPADRTGRQLTRLEVSIRVTIAAVITIFCVSLVASVIWWRLAPRFNAITSQLTAPSASARPTATAVFLTAPDAIGGWTKVADAQHQAALDRMLAEYSKFGRGNAAAGFYRNDPFFMELLAFASQAATRAQQDTEIEATFAARVRGSGGTLGTVAEVSPGKLGGTAKCAEIKDQTRTSAMCVWSSATSTGYVFWYALDLAHAQPEFIPIREAVERQG